MMTLASPWSSSLSLLTRVNGGPVPLSPLRFRFCPPRPPKLSPFLRPLSMAASSAQILSSGDAKSEVDVFQLVQAHQEKAARLPPVEEIRTVLDCSVRGMLSTLSHKIEGYPSGSMVDFACDADGSPILAISSLAYHSKV
ncbi:hypothetical protein BT93_A2436 [Corymbia citriodora subsp. variegata]|nr:hypothetical protein BT93_A2436 [Corymbia citriodora subsp. variegata]